MGIEVSEIFVYEYSTLTNTDTTKTTIRVSSDGLSFFTSNGENLAHCGSFQWAQSNNISNFEEAFSQIALKLKDKISTQNSYVLIDELGYVLVPLSIFDENEITSYLTYQLDQELIANSQILHKVIDNIVCISLVNQQLFDIVKSNFPNATVEGYNSGLLKTTNTLKSNRADYLGLISFQQGDSFDLSVKKRGQLIFFNRFKYATKEDFIYFLVMALTQLEIKSSDIELQLIGKIDQKSLLFNLLNLYFPMICFMQPDVDVRWDYHRYFVEQKN